MKESVFFETDIYEAGVQSGHQLSDFAHVHIADGKGKVSFFFLELYQVLVFQQSYGDFLRLYIYY